MIKCEILIGGIKVGDRELPDAPCSPLETCGAKAQVYLISERYRPEGFPPRRMRLCEKHAQQQRKANRIVTLALGRNRKSDQSTETDDTERR